MAVLVEMVNDAQSYIWNDLKILGSLGIFGYKFRPQQDLVTNAETRISEDGALVLLIVRLS